MSNLKHWIKTVIKTLNAIKDPLPVKSTPSFWIQD